MARMEALIRQRGVIKGKLTRFTTFLDADENELRSFAELELRSQEASTYLTKFEKIQDEIDLLIDEINDDDRNEFENVYFEQMRRAREIYKHYDELQRAPLLSASPSGLPPPSGGTGNSILNDVGHQLNNLNVAPLAVASAPTINLPSMTLPTFSGCHDSWIAFKDKFISLIHSNEKIQDVQKLHYLLSSLKSEPLELIETLEITDSNYSIAWDILNKTYENKRLIAEKLLLSIVNVPKLPKESAAHLRKLHTLLSKHMAAIKSLEIPLADAGRTIALIGASRLDNATRREWEELHDSDQFPELDELLKFIDKKCRVLDSVSVRVPVAPSGRSQHSMVTALTKPKCYMCRLEHFLYTCPEFLKLNPNDRCARVRQWGICSNCFRKGHFSRRCSSKFKCKRCGRDHHTLLHVSEVPTPSAPPAAESVCATSARQTTMISGLLPTAVLLVRDSHDQFHYCTALLDSASQSNFISSQLCNKLRLNLQSTRQTITGITANDITVSKMAKVHFRSQYNSFNTSVSCLVVDTITSDLPAFDIDTSTFEIPSDIKLADPQFHVCKPIDMLLGVSVFWSLLRERQIHLSNNLPVLQESVLGWIVSGPIPTHPMRTLCHFSREISNALEKFWSVEEIPHPELTDQRLNEVDHHFQTNHRRLSDGRFEVRLPLRHPPSLLGESLEYALRRLHSLETRLRSKPLLAAQYQDFMKEYIELKHMSEVVPNLDMPHYYIPHHFVLKPSSTTTQLRVVFDASASTSSGYSLNDILHTGPNIQNDLMSVLLRFRFHKFALVADITKMYRQVNVHESNRPLQRILWRFSESDSVKHFELSTVTYGMASSAYLAVACLRQLAHETWEIDKEISVIISDDFYVDDLLTGANTVSDLLNLKDRLETTLSSASFPLHKWSTNCRECPWYEDMAPLDFQRNRSPTCALGVGWSVGSDTLHFRMSDKANVPYTKRGILSRTASIFDPLGLVSPVVVIAKILLQQLWQLKTGWDDFLPDSINAKWDAVNRSLTDISEIYFPRRVTADQYTNLQLHIFCDASQQAYGACAYVKSVFQDGTGLVELLAAKSRVAPLKSLTIPKLELCAAALAIDLAQFIQISMRLPLHDIFFWSDSQITLTWIAGCPSRWKVFVSNRVSFIQTHSRIDQWHFVSGQENPADVLSRGCTAHDLINNDLWRFGPPWLSSDAHLWPECAFSHATEVPETKVVVMTSISTNRYNSLFSRFSNITTLIRVMCYILRFASTKISPVEISYNRDIVSFREVENATNKLIYLIQLDSFPEDRRDLTSGKPLRANSPILRLNPFINESGLIAVGGRLRHANICNSARHPVILPYKHQFSELIMRHEHQRLVHAGPNQTLFSVRQKYWPLCGRRLARKITRECIRCFRVSPPKTQVIMSDLPSFRVNPSIPFANVGVDYAGPVYVKNNVGRSSRLSKAYICVFICLSVKAIHLELVSDLTSDAFVAALRRFCARRGIPSTIYSDNGTNFVGANREMKHLYDLIRRENKSIARDLQSSGIKWLFIPPRAPHFGGIWEAAVKSTKLHLHKIFASNSLSWESYLTVLNQIEATLNSRPLYPFSDDPNDLSALTPGHFIIGRPITALPDPSLEGIRENKLNLYQKLQRYHQSFWKHWQRSYLLELNVRNRWNRNVNNNFDVGSLVIIREDNLPPYSWKLGRIVEKYVGDDGQVRVAKIFTADGIIKRPVTRLCVLPLDK